MNFAGGISLTNMAAGFLQNHYAQMDKDSIDWQYKKKEMMLANELDRKNQAAFNAVQYNNMVAGLRGAGLNPVEAAGMSPVSASSPKAITPSSYGTPDLAKPDFEKDVMLPLQQRLMNAQIDNVEADTAKKRYDADPNTIEHKLDAQQINTLNTQAGLNLSQKSLADIQTMNADLDNQHRVTVDATIDANLRKMYKDAGMDAEANYEGSYNMGTLSGIMQFNEMLSKLSEGDKDRVLNEVARQVAQMQLTDKDTLYALASMPEVERREVLSRIDNFRADTEYKKVLKETTQNESVQRIIESQDNDFVGLVRDGKYAQAATYLIPALAQAVGFAAAHRVMGAGRSPAPPAAMSGPMNSGEAAHMASDKALSEKRRAEALRIADQAKQRNERIRAKHAPHPLHARPNETIEERLNKYYLR